MKKLKRISIYLWHHKKLSITLIVILGVIGYFLMPKPPAEIETVKVKKTKIVQSVTASGKVDSDTTVNLSFITGGKLAYVGVKKGDEVIIGQTIATLDQRTMRTNLAQALEDYSLQRNEYDQTQENNQNHTPLDALNSTMKRILENNQNDLDKAVNSVQLQNLVIEQSVLSSPINGIVTRADVIVAGVNITPSTVFTVADPANLVFNTEVDEADIGKVSIGQQIQVIFDAFPDINVPLNVSYIDFASHVSEAGATVYTVKATLSESGNYRIGMNGDVDIIIDQKENVLTAPLSSLIDENHVYVKINDTYEKRKITTGLQSDTDIEIMNGLKENEIVALIPEEVDKLINKK